MALLLAALAALLAAAPPLPIYWLTTLVILGASAFLDAIRARLRLATAMGCAALGLLHLALVRPMSPMGWCVDLALVATAVAFTILGTGRRNRILGYNKG